MEDFIGDWQRFVDKTADSLLDFIVDVKDLKIVSDVGAGLERRFFNERFLEMENINVLRF